MKVFLGLAICCLLGAALGLYTNVRFKSAACERVCG